MQFPVFQRSFLLKRLELDLHDLHIICFYKLLCHANIKDLIKDLFYEKIWLQIIETFFELEIQICVRIIISIINMLARKYLKGYI